MTKDGKCGACIFWARIGKADRGECHVDRPQVVSIFGSPSTHWPITVHKDWCANWVVDAERAKE